MSRDTWDFKICLKTQGLNSLHNSLDAKNRKCLISSTLCILRILPQVN